MRCSDISQSRVLAPSALAVHPRSRAAPLTRRCLFRALRCAQVRFSETKSSVAHFLTSVCAIVGGVFTVSGLIDSFVYHGHRVLRKKMDLGKHI